MPIKNARPMPLWMMKRYRRSEWDKKDLCAFYHTTDLILSVSSCSKGLGRSFGAGSDAQLNAYGFPVGGSVVIQFLATALGMCPYHFQVGADRRAPGQKKSDPSKRRPSGACLMDRIDTLPIQPCWRLIGFKSDWIWHRGAQQVQFIPRSLYMSPLRLLRLYPVTVGTVPFKLFA